MRGETVTDWHPYVRVIATMLVTLIALLPANTRAHGFRIIYAFQGGSDGAFPSAPLIDIDGTLYGATGYGGGGAAPGCQRYGCGTIFSVTPAGVETVLYRFQGGSNGGLPCCLMKVGGVMMGLASSGKGTIIFSVTRQGSFSILRIVPRSEHLSWFASGRPITQVGEMYYGVVSGNASPNPPCSNRTCGYVFALAP